MKNGICVGVIVLCATVRLLAQNDSQVSQYMFNQVLFNPAVAGNGDMVDARYVNRMQYMGFDGAPSTWALGLSSPFRLLDADHGVSMKFGGDRIGNFDNTSFAIGYAYRHEMKKREGELLSVGFSLGGLSYDLRTPAAWSAYSSDPVVPQRAEAASTGFSVTLGALYSGDNWYVGLSCAHLNQPQVLRLEGGERAFTLARTFYLNGGYRWQMPNERLELEPAGLLMFTAIARPQLNLGVNLLFSKRHWLGLSHRLGDAIGFMGGMTIREGMRFGIAYEYPVSKLWATNGGNLELFAAYSFEMKFAKREKRYKSVRFL